MRIGLQAGTKILLCITNAERLWRARITGVVGRIIMEMNYNGVEWNTEDLVGCKQAAEILYYREQVPYEELCELDFGNLDLAAALGLE